VAIRNSRFKEYLSKESWLIRESGWDRDRQNVRETQMTLGNGYLSSRGILEEIPYDCQPGTFIAGLYDEIGSQVTEIVNLPNPVNFRLVVQGEKIDAVAMDVISHERILDMKKGLLVRRTVYQTAVKERFDYQSARFFSMVDPHIGVMKIRLTPLDADTDIIAETFLDTSITNRGILSEGRKRHFEVTAFHSSEKVNYTSIKTFQKKISVGFASLLKVEREKSNTIYATNDKFLRLYVKKGETITFTKFFSIHSTMDLGFKGDLKNGTVRSLKRAAAKGFEALLSGHEKAWAGKWERADIDIRPDKNLQTALRFNMYHLIISASGDPRTSVPARTYSGEGYRGHIFWDTDIFILPFFVYIFPEIARNLLLYRHRMLPAARRNAGSMGYKGALFAWESADTGEDETPSWHRDLDGKVIRIHTGELEHHISADIAFAVNNYYLVTKDTKFMLEAGLEIIFETARFWASRVTYNKSRDAYSIRHVIGPDEFHINVHDNAFTSYMARWNLVRAVQLYRIFEAKNNKRFKKMVRRIKLKEADLRKWARISNRMTIKTNRNGIIEAFRGYFKRRYRHIALYDDNMMPLIPRKITPRELKGTQFAKQADAIMLFALFPDSYPTIQKRRNFVYYDLRTLHKSSLSASMSALVGWEVGIHAKAYHYFVYSLYSDIENKHGNTAEGIHAAAAGGNWQVVFHGFAGVRIIDGKLYIIPSLAAGMNMVKFKFGFRGWDIGVTVSKKMVKILAVSKREKELGICVEGEPRKIVSGRESAFKLKKRIVNRCGLSG